MSTSLLFIYNRSFVFSFSLSLHCEPSVRFKKENRLYFASIPGTAKNQMHSFLYSFGRTSCLEASIFWRKRKGRKSWDISVQVVRSGVTCFFNDKKIAFSYSWLLWCGEIRHEGGFWLVFILYLEWFQWIDCKNQRLIMGHVDGTWSRVVRTMKLCHWDSCRMLLYLTFSRGSCWWLWYCQVSEGGEVFGADVCWSRAVVQTRDEGMDGIMMWFLRACQSYHNWDVNKASLMECMYVWCAYCYRLHLL